MSAPLSPDLVRAIQDLVAHYPKKEAALLPALHRAQQTLGHISQDTERKVAQLFGLPVIKVREVLTFYTMFMRQPVGRYHLQVCRNLSCSMLGAERLLEHLRVRWGLRPGETTPDRKFTLTTVECLGACEQAPCLMVNFDYFGNLDEKTLDDLMSKLE